MQKVQLLRFPLSSRDIRLLVWGLCCYTQRIGGILNNPKAKKQLNERIKASFASDGAHHVHVTQRGQERQGEKEPAGYLDKYFPFQHS